MAKSLIIDFGGYGAPESYAKLQDELRRKGQEPAVCAIMQILALRREQANVDAGDAAKRGDAAAVGNAAMGEVLREVLTTLHHLLNGQADEWLQGCFEPPQ